MILDTRSPLDQWAGHDVDLEAEVWRAEEVAVAKVDSEWIREVREHVANVADTKVDEMHDDELRRVLDEHVESASAAIEILDRVFYNPPEDELHVVFRELAELVGDWQARDAGE